MGCVWETSRGRDQILGPPPFDMEEQQLFSKLFQMMKMTDSCLNKSDQRSHIEDGNSELSSDFSILPEPQHSCMKSKEHLQVYLRIRPFSSAESSGGESQDCVTMETPDTVLLKPPSLSLLARLSSDQSLPQTGQRFQFSKVYGPETTQNELFEGTVKDLVKDVLEGGNSLVFTYGVTNSGKTFTFLGPDCEAGILPRSLHVIFSSIHDHVFQGLGVKPHRCREFTVLNREQQAQEALFKKNLLKQFKENEKSNISLLNMTNQTLLEGSTVMGTNAAAEDEISLKFKPNTKFSVWVSFCEIYNENIHDLLEVAPSGAPRRAALRLSQDVKGNAFVKDLRWVQVNSAEEAYKVVKLGRRNQSFSSTRLNQLSSRSHSIFSIRILTVEEIEPPRVHSISELCLCDLAGSERCAKTQNKGERLKEAGNINTSLLILGKCIKALRHNQQTKLLQHVPFRESKLTHYLQGFFCGRGRACMIVNINQCASMYDETLNVLKFSAVARKVVVLISRPIPIVPQASCSDSSFSRTSGRKTVMSSSSSSLTGWETSLEDVQEDEEEASLMEDTMDQTDDRESDESDEIIVSKRVHERQVALSKELQLHLKKERAENLLLETQVREEVSREFSELFSNMRRDYEERLVREKEILEERAERRLEIFKNLTKKMSSAGSSSDIQTTEALAALNEEKTKREEMLAALEYQTLGKEEALASLQEERKAREEAVTALEELRKKGEELLASLEEERKEREKATAALEAERRANQEATAQLEQEKQSKEEVRSALEVQRKEISRLVQDKEQRRQQEKNLTDKLEAQTQSAENHSAQIQAAEAELDVKSKEIQDQSCQIHILTQEVQRLNQELQTSGSSEGVISLLREEISELRKSLAEEKKNNDAKQKRIQELERELKEVTHQHLCSDQVTDKLKQTRAALEQQVEELNKKLKEEEELRVQLDSQRETSKHEADQQTVKVQEQEEMLEELRAQLQSQHQTSKQEAELLKAKLHNKTQASEQQVQQLSQKLQEQEVSSKQQLEKLEQKLNEQKAESIKLLEELKQKLREQQEAAEKLRNDFKEAQLSNATISSSAEDLQRVNADLQSEITSLKEKLSSLETTTEASSKMEQMITEKDKQMEEKLAQMETSAQREAVLQEKLQDAERQVTSLQKSLQEAKERREEEECQAVQEARKREAERRRELLAVAHEAIAQKDAELEKKAEEISRLKENTQQDAEKVKNLSLELQRKVDDSSDLREKLADYKKQIQQVQKEISSMREEEKLLKQKLTDVEKVKRQLQSDLSNRDRTIQQLRTDQPDPRSDPTLQLYQKACKELDAKQRLMEDMRLALTEQEETQEQMEQVLDEKMSLLQELSAEVEKLKSKLLQQDNETPPHEADGPSEDLKLAKDEASQAQESLKIFTEKHQAERRKWQEEKLSLIGQAKEAEHKRNQEMRKFAEDRERYSRQQSLLESKLVEKDKAMENWRKERDTLVAALEVQLQKLLSSQAEKDRLIKELQEQSTKQPPEVNDGGSSPRVAELQAALAEKEAEILRLKEDLEASARKQESTPAQTKQKVSSAVLAQKPKCETSTTNPARRETRVSVSSQGSFGFPSVLDSSEVSTENGRTSRFPRPELEISFSPLQPNRIALKRQGEENAVTVKITRTARKRKSGEMEKEEVEAGNRRNTRTKLTPKLTPQKEESSSPALRHDLQNSSRKDGTLQKIGDFLQSSPTLLGSKAKKMMGLVSGHLDSHSASSSSSLSLRVKRGRKKLYTAEISHPMEMPPHPIMNQETDSSESDHQVIKRRLRSRVAKC
ncbi:kinesin-like protein KIF20B isoform X3 [Girardinichthys multiradiatus]|uniref:kinesin-like protein KIF20B isoform X3 n=1 Tax=Girardinichthys multiradiatus TaxID=208333 RepID=UPI001FAD8EFF|nr:kinesin-like protein KIF20B isoform X3 [Girardinichthys multiradiatus]